MKNTAVEKVKEVIKTEDKIEKVKDATAHKLSDAAEILHHKTDEVQEVLGEKVENAEDLMRQKTYEVSDFTQQKLEKANQIGHRAADLINSSSEYIKQFDTQETKKKVITKLKRNPEIGMAAAGMFGLLVGFLVGRKSR